MSEPRLRYLIICHDGEVLGTNSEIMIEQFKTDPDYTVVNTTTCYIETQSKDNIVRTATRVKEIK